MQTNGGGRGKAREAFVTRVTQEDASTPMRPKTLQLDGTDIEVSAALDETSLTIKILKSGACVHTVVIDNAAERMEHAWLADCLTEKEHVDLRALEGQAFDFLVRTNTNQG